MEDKKLVKIYFNVLNLNILNTLSFKIFKSLKILEKFDL